MKEDFIPLLFAGDINVYSMARAFYEEYRIKPYVFGKYNTGPCYDSKIMHYTANPQIDQQPVFLENVEKFSKEHKDKTILVLGCGDSYVQLISENMDLFPENVVAPYIHADMMNNLIHKEKFYKMCQENGVDYPNTFVHRKELGEDFQLPFEAPFIVKPSNGIEYWKHPFPTQKKVYKAKDKFELLGILKDIYTSGYEDSIIIQDFIPSDNT
jgi:D-aspartate ligase